MSFEKTLQTGIITYLRGKGAVIYNIVGNEQQSGVPDLLVCYKGHFLGLEVKGPDGQLSRLQETRLLRIRNAGGIGEEVRSMQKVATILADIDCRGKYEHK